MTVAGVITGLGLIQTAGDREGCIEAAMNDHIARTFTDSALSDPARKRRRGEDG